MYCVGGNARDGVEKMSMRTWKDRSVEPIDAIKICSTYANANAQTIDLFLEYIKHDKGQQKLTFAQRVTYIGSVFVFTWRHSIPKHLWL